MKFLSNFLKGIVIGIANVIPGVSGGTMAVVLNIFDTLVAVLSLDIPTIKKKWKDVLFLFIGVGVGIVALSFIMELLLKYFPTQCNWFFAGVVLGSVPLILKKAETPVKKLSISKIVPFLLTLAVMIVIFIFTDSVDKESGAVLANNAGTFMYMILAGMIAAFCMIVPGISGSFILVVIGAYSTVISIVTNFNIILLGGLGIGVLLGLVLGAKLIKFLLKRFPAHTYLAILGLVLGSLPFLLDWSGIILVGVIAAGTLISYLFGKSEKE
jgi:putative membrane protein